MEYYVVIMIVLVALFLVRIASLNEIIQKLQEDNARHLYYINELCIKSKTDVFQLECAFEKSQLEQVKLLAKKGDKVGAMKAYRAYKKVGLKEAKTYVDMVMAQQGTID